MFFSKKNNKNPTEKRNLCIIPFLHLTSKPDGNVRLCCFSSKNLKGNLGTDSLENIWNSSEIKEIRNRMLNNEKLPECKNCWKEEAAGKVSRRVRSNSNFLKSSKDRLEEAQNNQGHVSKYPTYIDLRLGNTCNLKCRTCNPLFSSLWHKELESHQESLTQNPLIQSEYQYSFNKSKNINDWFATDTFFNSIKKMGKYLEVIYISGGEPLLIKQHHLFIDYLLEHKFHKNITIKISSNITILDSNLLKKLVKFKRIHFEASIDAYGDKNDWLRPPSRFHKIEKNMRTLLELPRNVHVCINCTVSVYNILYIDELMEWFHKISKEIRKEAAPVYTDLLHQPEFQNISILPFELKKIAINRLKKITSPEEKNDINSIIAILEASFTENEKITDNRRKLKEHTAIFDEWRREDFFSTFPEFAGYL